HRGRAGRSVTWGQAGPLLRDQQVDHPAVAALALALALALEVRVVHRSRGPLHRAPVALGPRDERVEVAAHARRAARVEARVSLAIHPGQRVHGVHAGGQQARVAEVRVGVADAGHVADVVRLVLPGEAVGVVQLVAGGERYVRLGQGGVDVRLAGER